MSEKIFPVLPEEHHSITEFNQFASYKDLRKHLKLLEEMALAEPWNHKVPREGASNTENPILENYLYHTFKRLMDEYRLAKEPEEKQSVLSIYNDPDPYKCSACFNLGLFTKNYNGIYALFYKNTHVGNPRPYFFFGFLEESDRKLVEFNPLPRRADFFTNPADFLFDFNAEVRVDIDHIIDDNRERFPEHYRDLPYLRHILEGAISHARKKVSANYKVAVPTYYRGEICLLLPLCLDPQGKPDLALAIRKENDVYIAKTCLTLDMAYNDARLIAKPDTDWLLP